MVEAFTSCILESCLYRAFYKGKRVYLTICVDDIIIACANLIYMNDIKRKFCEKFDMANTGELEFFLNVRVTRTKKFIQLTYQLVK